MTQSSLVLSTQHSCCILHSRRYSTHFLAGIPVYLNEDGLSYRHYRATANRLLWSKLTEQEKQLRQMGVIPLQNAQLRRVITAGAARELRRRSQKPPASAVITPLARDILEGLVP